MNPAQQAELESALRDVIAGAPDRCATLECAHGDRQWMQIVDCTINASYPHDVPPEEILRRLPVLHEVRVVGWEARKFVTFQMPSLEDVTLPRWIDAYFVNVLGCPAEASPLRISFQNL